MKSSYSLLWRIGVAAAVMATGLRAQITTNAAVTPAVQTDGQAITLTRDGSASAGMAWTENVIQRPNATTADLGHLGLGSMSYTPDGGPGVYWYHFKIRDANGVYGDQSIPFVVGEITLGSGAASLTVGVQSDIYFPTLFSQDRIVVGAGMALDSVTGSVDTSNWGDEPYGGDWTFSYQPWTAGTHTLRVSVVSHPWGREDASTPETSGAPSEITWFRDFTLTVNKATPFARWTPPYSGQYQNMYYFPSPGSPSANRQGYYTLTAADVTALAAAVYVHPSVGNYASIPSLGSNLRVAGPGSPVTYRRAGTTTTLATGMQWETGQVGVEAVFAGDANYNSATSTIYVTVLGPGTPASVQAVFGSTLLLSWTAVSGATAYDIYRNGTFLATITSGTTYVDTTAPVGGTVATHTYVVRAVDSAARGSTAATVTLTNAAGPLELFTPTP